MHVIPSVSPEDGGPTKAMGLIERALSEAGIKVTTVTTDHGLISPGLSGGRPSARVNGASRIYAHKWIDFYKFAPGLAIYLACATRSYDVVHVHALFSFAPTAAALIARWSGVPYIVRPLGTLSTYGMSMRRRRLKQLSVAIIERRILRSAAAVHFTSQAELDEAANLGLQFRGVVIPLGIEPEAMSRLPRMSEFHAALDGRRIALFLSRLDPKKNLEALIDAIASDALRRSWGLLIAGSGEASYVATLKTRAAMAGASDLIVWLGHVEGAKKASALAAADVFVLPSFSENFGIAAVEALFAGKPCILGKGVAIASAVEQAGAGFCISPESCAIARSLKRIQQDEALKDKMGQRARAFAQQAYSTHAMTQRLIALYEEACNALPRHGS